MVFTQSRGNHGRKIVLNRERLANVHRRNTLCSAVQQATSAGLASGAICKIRLRKAGASGGEVFEVWGDRTQGSNSK